MSDLVESSVETMRTHPKLFVFVIFVAFICGGVNYRVFAQKREVDKLAEVHAQDVGRMRTDMGAAVETVTNKIGDVENKVKSLEVRTDTGFLLLKMDDLEREIYQLESLEAKGEARQRDTDRLITVRRDLQEAQRQLNMLTR